MAKDAERDLLRQFCFENNFDFPTRPECVFVAIEDGKLVGLCALKKVYQVEPLINVSGSALVTQILAEKVLACAGLVTHEVMAMTQKPDLYERYGMVVTDKDMTILTKGV